METGRREMTEEYAFGQVRDAIMMGTNVVVLDSQAQDVRIFDEAGDFVRRVASKGRGPGELTQASSLAKVSEDEFLVVESFGGRAHLFTAAGEFVRTLTFGGRIDPIFVADAEGRLYVRPAAPTVGRLWGGDGRVQLGRINGLNAAGVEYIGMIRREQLEVMSPGTVRMDTSGQVHDTIPAPVLPDPLVYVDVPTGRAIYGFEFQPFPWWAWTRSGRLLVGRTDESVIEEVVLSDGTRRAFAHLPRTSVPVAEPDRRAIQEAIADLGEMDGSVVHAPSEGWIVKPMYRGAMPSDAGGIWIATHVESEEKPGGPENDTGWHEPTQEYIVVAEDGTIEGRVTAPGNVTLLYAGSGTALGRRTDSLGIQSVLRLEVVWH